MAVVLSTMDISAAEVALQLKGGVSAAGQVQYIDGRGIGLIRTGGGVITIPASQLSPSSLKDWQSWISGDSMPAGIQADHDLSLQTQVGTLAYDTNELSVSPGSMVRVSLVNADDLQHNIVFSQSPDENSGQALAMAAIQLGAEGMSRQWIPDSDGMLAASSMADPHKTVSVFFRAPEENGLYPYVCTFPGHAAVMKGVLIVGEVQEAGSEVTLSDIRWKAYKGAWDRLPDFDAMEPSKSGTQTGRMDMMAIGYREEFGVVFNAKLKVSMAGDYSFGLSSDDGSRLFINDIKVVDIDGVHGMNPPVRGKIRLSPGDHDLKIEFFERNGGEGLYAEVAPPRGAAVLLTPGQSPAADNTVGIPLYPGAGQAMIYRNFIDGVGTARGIGVGFSDGIHYAYDAQNGRLAMIWRGGFIDAKRHWTGRGVGYQPPSEEAVVVDAPGAMMAVLDSPDDEWPADDYVAMGKSGDYSAPGRESTSFRFRGYDLETDTRRPVFLWEWNGLKVKDEIRPGGSTADLIRTLTIDGKADVAGKIFLRVGDAGDGLEVKTNPALVIHHADDGLRVPVANSGNSSSIEIHYNLKN